MSGNKQIVINTLERAASNDINRLQALRNAIFSEVLMRTLLDKVHRTAQIVSDSDGSSVEFIVTEAPLRAIVFDGLLVIPGTTSLTIRPGTLAAINDALAGADDSNCVVVDSEGEPSTGVITFTANGGGGDRIDVVECAVSLVTTETTTRDIFDEITQTFSPTVVDKVTGFQLTFRKREGTASAGYPGSVSGWLPLAVLNVPNTAVDFEDCTFWDVRPLLADRGESMANTLSGVAYDHKLYGRAALEVGTQRLDGVAEGIGTPEVDTVPGRWVNWRVGGKLRRSVPGADNDFIDVSDATNISPSFTGYATANGWSLFAVFPHDLPRWCRYAQVAATTGGERLPWGPLGICVVSDWASTNPQGFSSLQLPVGCGLGAGVHPGRTIVAGMIRATTDAEAMSWVDGRHTFAGSIDNNLLNGNDTLHSYNVAGGPSFPHGAKEIYLDESMILNGVTAGPSFLMESVHSMEWDGEIYEVHRRVTNVSGTATDQVNTGHSYWAGVQNREWPLKPFESHVLRVATNHAIPGPPTVASVLLSVRGWVF